METLIKAIMETLMKVMMIDGGPEEGDCCVAQVGLHLTDSCVPAVKDNTLDSCFFRYFLSSSSLSSSSSSSTMPS